MGVGVEVGDNKIVPKKSRLDEFVIIFLAVEVRQTALTFRARS